MSKRWFTALFVALSVGASALAVGPRGGELHHTAGAQLHFDETTSLVNELVQLPSFPTQLGRLTGVRVELWLEISNRYGLENIARVPGHTSLSLGEAFGVRRAGGDYLVSGSGGKNGFYPFPAFDGEKDFDGPSGTTEEWSSAELYEVELPPDRDWTDLGVGQNLTLDLRGLIDFTLTGGGTVKHFLEGAATMRVEVTYRYQ